MKQIENINACLLSHHIKPSVQRLAVMKYLVHNRIHPTADEIYHALSREIPTLSKTTVYNTLKLFAEQGALQMLAIDDKNVRFDVDTSVHAHFRCNSCCRVYDVPVENIDLIKPAGLENWKVTEMQLYYKGYCKDCLSGQKDKIDKTNN